MSIPFAGLGLAGEYPQQIIDDTTVRGGLRHVYIGEEGETWVFLGHAYHRDVLAAIETINREDGIGLDVEDLPCADQLEYTYARHLNTCPDHAEIDDSCDLCHAVADGVSEGGWYLDWANGGPDRKANRGKPGYFPVVLWDVEG